MDIYSGNSNWENLLYKMAGIGSYDLDLFKMYRGMIIVKARTQSQEEKKIEQEPYHDPKRELQARFNTYNQNGWYIDESMQRELDYNNIWQEKELSVIQDKKPVHEINLQNYGHEQRQDLKSKLEKFSSNLTIELEYNGHMEIKINNGNKSMMDAWRDEYRLISKLLKEDEDLKRKIENEKQAQIIWQERVRRKEEESDKCCNIL